MSETRYTPEQMRAWKHEEAMHAVNKLTPMITGKAFDPDWFLLRQRFEDAENMLRQAATDAEALEAKDKRIAALEQENFEQKRDIERHIQRFAQLDGGYKAILDGERGRLAAATTALTAERQKVRELREYLDNEIVVAIKCDEQSANTTDANWFRGKAEGYAWAVKCMDTLGLTGDATEGQG